MNEGQRITDRPLLENIPEGSSYLVEAGDGSGAKRVTHEQLVEAIKKALPIGELKEVGTEAKDTVAEVLAEIFVKATTEFTGTDGLKPGTAGVVPAPQPEDAGKVLGADGKWVNPSSGGGSSAEPAYKGILKSIEELEANTDEGYLADALSVKEISSKFGGITKFIVNEESGQITGYKTKVGADTVFPFSSAGQDKVIYQGSHSGSGLAVFDTSDLSTITVYAHGTSNTNTNYTFSFYEATITSTPTEITNPTKGELIYTGKVYSPSTTHLFVENLDVSKCKSVGIESDSAGRVALLVIGKH